MINERFMKAISTAFVEMVDILNNERNITASDLERIHYLAVDGVKDSRINEDLRGGCLIVKCQPIKSFRS